MVARGIIDDTSIDRLLSMVMVSMVMALRQAALYAIEMNSCKFARISQLGRAF